MIRLDHAPRVLQPVDGPEPTSHDGSVTLPVDTRSAPSQATSTASEDRLPTHARVLAGLLSHPDRIPSRWRAPGFARQVDLVRAHLRPIRSRESLSLSYSREHFHINPVGAQPVPLSLLTRSATDVAYAHRWLELGGEGGEGPWVTLLGGA